MEKGHNKPQKSAVRGEYVGQIVAQRRLGSEHVLLVIELVGVEAEVFSQARAGQFVQIACRGCEEDATSIKVGPTMLRRPFSIAGLSRKTAVDEGDKLYLEIIYRLVGLGTRWLAGRGAGEKINLLGPLGSGFRPLEDRNSKILLVGGGVGLPPLYLLAGQLAQAGYENVVGFAGAQRVNLFAGEVKAKEYDGAEPLKPQMVITQFARSGISSIAATDDGSFGYAGSVVEALEQFIEEQKGWGEAYLYACGPYGMLKAVAEAARRRKMGCQVCMEAYMACGIGVCQSCVVGWKGKPGNGVGSYKLVCSDGPVFDAEMINWE